MNIRIKKNQDRKKVWHHISDLCRYLRSLKYNYSETIKQIKAGGARVKPFGCQMRESSVYSNSGHFLLAVYVYHGIKLVRMKAGNIVQNNSDVLFYKKSIKKSKNIVTFYYFYVIISKNLKIYRNLVIFWYILHTE